MHDGTIEIWRAVVGFEGTYEVSNLGRVRSLDRIVVSRCGVKRFFRGIVKRTFLCGAGYPSVVLRRNGYVPNKNIHVLVMEAFAGPAPEGMEICHDDGDKLNPALTNLRYDTRSANIQDRVKHGGGNLGESNYQAKLTDENVRIIRGLKGYESESKLASRFGVSRSVIHAVHVRKTWRHIADHASG